MALPIIPIITALGSLISGPIQRWQETKAVRHKAEITRIESGDKSAAELDRLSIASRGWKDDYLLIITTLPVVCLFVDPFFPSYNLAAGITEGFKALNLTPEYYWYALGIIYIDTFGFRRMVRVAVEHWLNGKSVVKNKSQGKVSENVDFLNQGD